MDAPERGSAIFREAHHHPTAHIKAAR